VRAKTDPETLVFMYVITPIFRFFFSRMSTRASSSRQLRNRSVPDASPERREPNKSTKKPAAKKKTKTIFDTICEKWNASKDADKTSSNLVIFTADACANNTIPETPLYTGSAKISKEIPQIPQTVLELYRSARSMTGAPISESAMIQELDVEYATNISWMNGSLHMVTGKYVGIEFSASMESVVPDMSSPSTALIDLVYNCLELKLCTVQQIKEFVSIEPWKGARAYLLSDADVMTLVKHGVHEQFKTQHGIVVKECMHMIDDFFTHVQNIEWVEFEEQEEEEAYFYC
jgi:hypothetical protein